MTPTLLQFLIVCPAVFIAGYIDAIAGGGGLITLPTYLLVGLPVHNAIATNKFGASAGTAIATLRYAQHGCVDFKLSLLCVPFALLGSTLGAELALLVPDSVFKPLMLVILPVVAWYALRGKSLEGGLPLSELPKARTLLLVSLICLGMGVYDGFYGPGMGTFLLLLLTGPAHLELELSAGTTKVINLCSGLGAVVVFMLHGQVIYSLALAAAACSIVGNYLGVASFEKKGVGLVRPVILTVLGLFFVKVIYELFT